MSLMDDFVMQGTLAARPLTAIWGALYFTTDTGQAFIYDGGSAVWDEIHLYPQSVAFASLPGSPVRGMQYVVTDATVNTWGAVVSAGGGTDVVLAWYNGTAWTVIGA